MEGSGSNILMKVLIEAIKIHRGVEEIELGIKFALFGANNHSILF